MERRYFISQVAVFGGSTLAFPSLAFSFEGRHKEYKKLAGLENPADEKAWAQVASLFPKPKNFTQLEHGYFSHAMVSVLKHQQLKEEFIQQHTSYFMRREQEQSIEEARSSLANYFGWENETIALTRNTTESLNTIIQGFPWKTGDEVVIGNQDYGSMTESFFQAAERYGIVVRQAEVPLKPESDEQIVSAYLKLVNEKTKMLHLTHMINLSGQVIPIEQIIRRAKQSTIGNQLVTVVDAAHSVAHISFNWKESEADVVAGSLHKWMCAPIGIGFLKVRRDLISIFWPLMADRNLQKTDIRKFEHQGTRPIQAHLGLIEAIRMQNIFGSIEVKAERLYYLKKYWTEKLKQKKNIEIQTPTEKQRSGAIANVSVNGYSAPELSERLWEKYRIFTVAVVHPAINGVRITPHLSTSTSELDLLVKALSELADSK